VPPKKLERAEDVCWKRNVWHARQIPHLVRPASEIIEAKSA
jgi:hypothetical protein